MAHGARPLKHRSPGLRRPHPPARLDGSGRVQWDGDRDLRHRPGPSVDPAKATCHTCVVRPECLAYAMTDEDLMGVWGETSAKERERMRRGAVA